MDKQKLAVVLLVVAIVLSIVNIGVSLGFDVGDYVAPGSGVAGGQTSDSAGGQIGLTILPGEANS